MSWGEVRQGSRVLGGWDIGGSDVFFVVHSLLVRLSVGGSSWDRV